MPICSRAYQVAEENLRDGNVRHHQVMLFLAAVQAVCYIICFKAEEWAMEKCANGVHRKSVLNTVLHGSAADESTMRDSFLPVVEASCRPLSRIRTHIGVQFCRSIKAHNFAAYQIAKECLRQGQVEESIANRFYQGPESGLEACFPFDPYRLRHSHIFFMGVYKQWQGAADDSEDESDPGDMPVLLDKAGFRDAFGVEDGRHNTRAMSTCMSEGGGSEDDFTDTADHKRRGFVASVGPSPAFGPRRDPTDMQSPLFDMQMDIYEREDDDFVLPGPSMTLSESDSLLDRLMDSAVYCDR